MSYLNDFPKLLNGKCTATTVADFMTFANLKQTMATRAAYYVDQTNKLLKSSDAPEKEKMNDLFAVNVQRAVKTHIQYLMFIMAVDTLQTHKFKDQKI